MYLYLQDKEFPEGSDIISQPFRDGRRFHEFSQQVGIEPP
jgi:hypothetical protein